MQVDLILDQTITFLETLPSGPVAMALALYVWHAAIAPLLTVLLKELATPRPGGHAVGLPSFLISLRLPVPRALLMLDLALRLLAVMNACVAVLKETIPSGVLTVLALRLLTVLFLVTFSNP